MPQDTSIPPTTPSHSISAVEIASSPFPSLACPSSPLDSPLCIHTSPIPVAPAAPTHHIVIRSQTSNLKPKSFSDFKLFRAVKHPLIAFHTLALPLEPSTYCQAATTPEWVEAMRLEYNALLTNNTWSLCPRPLHQNVVRNKWVFKLKQKPDGNIDRFKACLIAKGFDQVSGVDY